MANTKITELTSLASGNLHTGDVLPIVDVDVNGDGNTADAETKKISIGEFKTGIFNSPNFTGTPTADTASTGTFTNQIATTKFAIRSAAVYSRLPYLNDVTITSIANGHVIVYDSSSSKYVNKTLLEAGISPVGHSHIPTWVGDAKLADYTADAVESGGALSIDPIQSQYPSATTPSGNPVDNADTTTDLAVDQAGNVVRTAQEATWTLTAAQINNLPTTAGGVELIEAPGTGLYVIIEKVTFLINYTHDNGSMATAQRYEINQDGNVSDSIAVINGTRINGIVVAGGNTNTHGIYEHDNGYATLNRSYKPNAATTIRKQTTDDCATAIDKMTIKMRYRVYDVDTF